jgi:hypothetical protein
MPAEALQAIGEVAVGTATLEYAMAVIVTIVDPASNWDGMRVSTERARKELRRVVPIVRTIDPALADDLDEWRVIAEHQLEDRGKVIHALYYWDGASEPETLRAFHARSSEEGEFDLGAVRYFAHRISRHMIGGWKLQERLLEHYELPKSLRPADYVRTDEGGDA